MLKYPITVNRMELKEVDEKQGKESVGIWDRRRPQPRKNVAFQMETARSDFMED
jgi:hypothetical protein